MSKRNKSIKSKYSKKIFSLGIVLTILSLILLTGCKNVKKEEVQTTPISRNAFKLNTVINITLYDTQDESVLDGVMELCDKYEQIFSRTSETSELYRLNHGLLEKAEDKSGYKVSDILYDLLERGYYYSDISKGIFDISVEPATSLWNFTSTEAVVPEKEQLAEAVTRIGYEDIELKDGIAGFKKEGMGIDLGAVAKGYIADLIKDYLLERGVKSAMINLGGNVLCVGEKPDGRPFKVGIQKPFADRNEIVATMELKDRSVVTSGIYERYFIKDNVLYHHILDPATGYPVNMGLISVTIISKSSVDGEGLSTTCFALGLEKGTELIESMDDVYAVFITEDYQIHYTKGFRENIKISEEQ
ncbi:FAD:protein FMN transferase [Anaerocolumna cellulosilytica]|uniref:FAD:protein FMN transferase n=1 Tax=Anaerocolumna cellulosilytica TaxID=433286 RepID=A0A6S6R1C3_9FIRM|nr:FAD:protein FMN transferase [Anaerocolumna cellulosilytica]MBB5195221.1 thiamine biosynthesis lipoprotein [Anaerocolumna cellulosilytica]BCJ96694.1 FAD:protein FMN transferase [Anaerocolumna cellulosilytica]